MKLKRLLRGLVLTSLCHVMLAEIQLFDEDQHEFMEGEVEARRRAQLRGSSSLGGNAPASLSALVDGPYPTGIIGVAGAHLPNGIILLWSAHLRDQFSSFQGGGTGQTYTVMFNASDGSFFEELIVDTNHDMFCSGTAYLCDGRIMITGGNDADAVTIYDPAINKWYEGPKMKVARAYHSMTPLSDGSVFAHGGSWRGGIFDKNAEEYKMSLRGPRWTLKPGIPGPPFYTKDFMGVYRRDNHYWLFQAPNGLVFHAGPSQQMHWVDVRGDGSVTNSTLRDDDEDAMCGNAVMYDIGKILTLGGSRDYDAGQSSNRAYVIDINAKEATVERVGDMAFGRTFHNSIVLPSGEIVVVGGQSVVEVFADTYVVHTAELWNPSTRTFTKLFPPLTIPRLYHSIGLLLKDGRVLVGGGGLCSIACPSVDHPNVEILTPPYLLDGDGKLATRPVIETHPSHFNQGGKITLEMKTEGNYTFALIRLGVATHATNNDQRRIPLNVIGSSNRLFNLAVPSNRDVVLPGPYYLFAMNENGVPSVGVDIMRANNFPCSAG